jgi:hypothetical protein
MDKNFFATLWALRGMSPRDRLLVLYGASEWSDEKLAQMEHEATGQSPDCTCPMCEAIRANPGTVVSIRSH